MRSQRVTEGRDGADQPPKRIFLLGLPAPRTAQETFDADNQLGSRHAQGGGQAEDGSQGRVHLAAFEQANVRPMVAALKPQLLL